MGLVLFNRSVLKQAKFRQIVARLDDTAGKRALDIGADNGVISYLLRQRGGHWRSADLETAVSSIRQLCRRMSTSWTEAPRHSRPGRSTWW